MKKFIIRQAETVKTTAAVYGCDGCPELCSGPVLGAMRSF